MKVIKRMPANRAGVTDFKLPPNSKPLSVVMHNSMLRGKVIYVFWLLPDGWEHMELVNHRISGFQAEQGVPAHIIPGNFIGHVSVDGDDILYFLER